MSILSTESPLSAFPPAFEHVTAEATVQAAARVAEGADTALRHVHDTTPATTILTQLAQLSAPLQTAVWVAAHMDAVACDAGWRAARERVDGIDRDVRRALAEHPAVRHTLVRALRNADENSEHRHAQQVLQTIDDAGGGLPPAQRRSLAAVDQTLADVIAQQPDSPDADLHRMLQVLQLRRRRAAIVGATDFFALQLRGRMLDTTDQVLAFLRRRRDALRPSVDAQTAAMQRFVAQSADLVHTAAANRRQRRARFAAALLGATEQELSPYFALDSVVAGLVAMSEQMFGISLVADKQLPCWHPAVRGLRVFDGQQLRGVLYLDLTPRPGKRDSRGAWTQPLRTGAPTPHAVAVVANVPGSDRTLSMRGVSMLAHEWGHALHHLCSDVSVPTLGGLSVALDFVEFPAQLFERLMLRPSILDRLLRHRDDQRPVPVPWRDGLLRAQQATAAHRSMHQVALAALDHALHVQLDPTADVPALLALIRQTFDAHGLADVVTEPEDTVRAVSVLFDHPTGYAGGYYSYPWAEALAERAGQRFESAPHAERELGAVLRRTILARGADVDPHAALARFMDAELTPAPR